MKSKPSTDRPRASLERRLHADDRGATSLEWVLLIGAVVLPSYAAMRLALELLVTHYRMLTVVNSLPFP